MRNELVQSDYFFSNFGGIIDLQVISSFPVLIERPTVSRHSMKSMASGAWRHGGDIGGMEKFVPGSLWENCRRSTSIRILPRFLGTYIIYRLGTSIYGLVYCSHDRRRLPHEQLVSQHYYD